MIAKTPDLTIALIRAGNLPADERRQNEEVRTRIGRALYEISFALTAWRHPDGR